MEVWILSLHPFLSRICSLFGPMGSLVPFLFIFKLLLPPLPALISSLTLLMLGFLKVLMSRLLLLHFPSDLLAMVGFLLPAILCNVPSPVYQRACLPSGISWGHVPHILVADCKFFLPCYSLLLLYYVLYMSCSSSWLCWC